MIYTLTLNPSIDYVIYPENPIQIGKLNRFEKSDKYPGGKGINVSRILNELSIQSVALGFVGGFTGKFIVDQLNQSGISNRFITIDEDTRMNVKLKGTAETEINGAGPYINTDKQEELLQQFKELEEDDIVVLAGSKPSSLPEDFYQTLIASIEERGAAFAIDTTGDELINALSYRPLLVKPNKEELEKLYSTVLSEDKDIVQCGKDLLSKGAEHVIISMGKDGAFLITAEAVYHGQTEPGELVNSVGAGDSMVAGFVGKFQESGNPIESFQYSLACGSATAFSDDLASFKDIKNLANKVSVIQLID
ncbi:MAG: 1-phosphofructokinase [Alkalibacterium sp.]|nr:1-phosphofructokinase [Alkalibacterium sp.]